MELRCICLLLTLLSTNLLLPVTSAFSEQKNFFPYPFPVPGNAGTTPPSGTDPSPPSIGTPPSSQGTPPSQGGGGGGYTPTPSTPPSHGGGGGGYTPTPSTPPSHGGGGGYTPTPSTPPSHGGGGGYTPTPSTPPSHGGGGGHTPTPSTPSGGNCGVPPSHGSTPSTPRTPDPSHGTPSHGGGTTPSTPSHGGSTPSTPSHGGGYSYPPPTPSGGGSPPVPVIGTPPIDPGTPIVPGTPTIPSPPFLPAPFPSTGGTCDYWRNHPGLIWGVLGWWGTLGGVFGSTGLSVPGFSPTMSLQEALSNTRRDGLGSLYREGTASFLNSMVNHRFPYNTKQVRERFTAALGSNHAAGRQARLFRLANEGRLKPRN